MSKRIQDVRKQAKVDETNKKTKGVEETVGKTKSVAKTNSIKTKTEETKTVKTKADRTNGVKTNGVKTNGVKTSVDKTKTVKTNLDKTKTDQTKSDKTKQSVKAEQSDITKTDISKSDVTKIDTMKTAKLKTNSLKTEDNRVFARKMATNKKILPEKMKITSTKTSGTSPKDAKVSKSQFFPNKTEMYKNALKEHKSGVGKTVTGARVVKNLDLDQKKVEVDKHEKNPKKDRNRTRTLSPSEVKVLQKREEPTRGEVKRPGTATIKKIDAEETYESDFDSYESDFEEYQSSGSSDGSTSSEIESTDLSEAVEIKDVQNKDGLRESGNKIKEIDENIDEIKGIEENQDIGENFDDTKYNSKGFKENIEEEKKLDSGTYEITEPPNKHKQILSNIPEHLENQKYTSKTKAIQGNLSNLTSLTDEGFEEIKTEKLNFLNFSEAKRRSSQTKFAETKRKRGKELLGMIHLDSQYFAIFELKPISYEIFMKSYGNCNYIQSFVQTGDDNVDEETITDQNECRTVWTQYPTKLDCNNFNNLKLYQNDYLGVGSIEQIDVGSDILKYNEHNLNAFIKHCSEPILTLLEEQLQRQYQCGDIENNDEMLPFSDGHITFNTNLDYLKELKITSVTFNENTTKILTVHNSSENSKSLLCLWKISDQDYPEKIFFIYGYVSCCNLNNINVYSGLNDGSISIWKTTYVEYTKVENDNFISPNFISNIEMGHTSNVISIIPIDDADSTEENCNNQIYTLDEDGLLIIWSEIELRKHTDRLEINLHINAKTNLKQTYELSYLKCTDMCINKRDPTHVFVSTNNGTVLHFITSGKKSHPKFYTNCHDSALTSNCLAGCPFSPLYFLCGYQNGNVVLFSRETEKPLTIMSNTNPESPVEFLEWSVNKPCVFYTKDAGNMVHVWDLTKSDIYPVFSIDFKDRIDFVKLSPGISQNNTVKKTYMVIVTNNYTVTLYILNKEHGQQDPKDYEDNVRKFTNYVNRL